MADKPIVQIVLPPMPDPKQFGMAFGNPITDAAHYQLALTAWEKVSLAAVQSAVASQGQDGTDVGALPYLPFPGDKTKN